METQWPSPWTSPRSLDRVMALCPRSSYVSPVGSGSDTGSDWWCLGEGSQAPRSNSRSTGVVPGRPFATRRGAGSPTPRIRAVLAVVIADDEVVVGDGPAGRQFLTACGSSWRAVDQLGRFGLGQVNQDARRHAHSWFVLPRSDCVELSVSWDAGGRTPEPVRQTTDIAEGAGRCVGQPGREASARGPRSCPRSPRAPGARRAGRGIADARETFVPRPDGGGAVCQRSSSRLSTVALMTQGIGINRPAVESAYNPGDPLGTCSPVAERGWGGDRERAPRPLGTTPGGRQFSNLWREESRRTSCTARYHRDI